MDVIVVVVPAIHLDQGVFTRSESFDDQDKIDKREEDDFEFLES